MIMLVRAALCLDVVGISLLTQKAKSQRAETKP
jgi:hypothetical protein